MVRGELLQRGVDRDIADEAVSEMDDEEAAMRAAAGPARRLASLDRATFTRRLGGYLAAAGSARAWSLRPLSGSQSERALHRATRGIDARINL